MHSKCKVKVMKTITRRALMCGVAVIPSLRFTASSAQSSVTPAEARAIAEDAYIYGYPLVTLEMTRRITTNTADPAGLRAPMGQFAHAR